MRPTDTSTDRQAVEQATQWLARLDGEAGAETRAAFERWRDASPAHAAAYRQVSGLWQESADLVRNTPQLREAARHELQYASAPRHKPRSWWLPAVAFATLAVVAVVGVLRWPFAPEPPPGTRYATAAGEQRSIALADGSTLTLDTQTVLLERFSANQRRIDLQQGRAEFQVRGDPARPFVVHANGGTVTAVGTRFQVRVAESDATVTLLEGEVRVATQPPDGQAHAASLRPGQAVRYSATGNLGTIATADLKAARGWTEGKLYVDNWRLQDFVTELNRYSTTQLRIDDPALRDMRISGVFQTGNRDNLARLLSQGWGIHSRPTAPNEILLTRQ